MLRVTKLTDYATVVLTVLAAHCDQVLSASELAEQAGLEAPTVSKILKPLSQAGLVEGLRGVHGGYRLARAASDITLVEIVEAMEGPLAITECSQNHSQCGIAHTCGVRSNWRLINDVVGDALRRVTLAQMLQPSPTLATPVGVPSPHASRPPEPSAAQWPPNLLLRRTPRSSNGWVDVTTPASLPRSNPTRFHPAWTKTSSVRCRPRKTSRNG